MNHRRPDFFNDLPFPSKIVPQSQMERCVACGSLRLVCEMEHANFTNGPHARITGLTCGACYSHIVGEPVRTLRDPFEREYDD